MPERGEPDAVRSLEVLRNVKLVCIFFPTSVVTVQIELTFRLYPFEHTVSSLLIKHDQQELARQKRQREGSLGTVASLVTSTWPLSRSLGCLDCQKALPTCLWKNVGVDTGTL